MVSAFATAFRLATALVVIYTVYGASLLDYDEEIFGATENGMYEGNHSYWLCHVGHLIEGQNISSRTHTQHTHNVIQVIFLLYRP